MRINRYVALSTGMSRRAADTAVAEARVHIDSERAVPGQEVTNNQTVTLDDRVITLPINITTILLNKPTGYVCSRNGQGSKTIYELLPSDLHNLKPVGRLDKDSSGLLLLTNDGILAQELTHPSRKKLKIYEVDLDRPLTPLHRQMLQDFGIQLEDGLSKFKVERITEGDDLRWRVIMHEGRNRQIRRTFASLGYGIINLHRTHFGPYALSQISPGTYTTL